ncbi:MAG: hypothetical protein QGG88_02230 [Gammaproteobacteria bacterium]|jgi:hypothetical protein|nr:hypothetical protein [Gammaproteobacteria bacterium]
MLSLVYGLAFAWLAYNCWHSHVSAAKTAALAALFIALQQVAISPLLNLSPDHSSMLMLSNGVNYISLPLVAMVVLHHSLGWQWQAATWGRIFLGLAAMFELGRRSGLNADYLLVIIGLWIAVLVTSAGLFTHHWNNSQRIILAISGLYLAWILYSYGPFNMAQVLYAAQATVFIALFIIYRRQSS